MKKYLFLFGLILSVLFAKGQDILMTIDGQPVTKEEFKRVYLKNNIQDTITEKDIDNYLDLFINFKLKVKEAENEGYDTSKSFLDEYNKYLGQLAEPYFLDTALQNKLLHQAYDRTKKEVRLSYVVIYGDQDDTTEAYEKAMKVYKEAIAGKNFDSLVMKYSDARNKIYDKGDAWYNGVLTMPYKIENFAYENPVGSISKPIRIRNSYYVLKITGVRKGIPKRVRVSHIYVRLQQNPKTDDSIKAMKLLDTIKNELEKGIPFEKVAQKYSQDKATAVKGGDVGWFSTGKMFRSFEKAAYSIQNVGDYIGPIRTPAGYHFVKLTGRETYGTFDNEKDDLLNRIKKSDRYRLVKENIYKKLKKEYNFKLTGDLNDFYTKVDSSIFKNKWRDTIFKNDNRVLATFADQKILYSDFAKYLQDNQRVINPRPIKSYIDEKFNEYVNERLKDYEITQLPSKNSDFKYLLQEYHDGLLLFDITNDKVWEKAVKDTNGLKNYYKNHRNNYYEKLNVAIYSYDTPKTKKTALKYLKKKDKKQYSDSLIVVLTNKKGLKLQLDTSGVFKPEDDSTVAYVADLMKNNKISENQNIIVNDRSKKIIYLKDNFPYIKGLVTADYQNVLEQQWIKELRNKYKVELNKEVWEKTKKEILDGK